MLVFEGNVEETFMQSFQIGYTDVFGATLTHNLKEGGSELMVNNDNRQVNNQSRDVTTKYVGKLTSTYLGNWYNDTNYYR